MILECNRGDLPRFVALNLDKLPPISIDCIDVSALLRKQQLMEMDMSQLKSTVDEVLKEYAKEQVGASEVVATKLETRCERCADGCMTCIGPNDNNCVLCRRGLFHFNGQCVNSCPPGTFGEAVSGECVACWPGCDECSGQRACRRCARGWMPVRDGTCHPDNGPCPEGEFYDGESCGRCHRSCLACTGPMAVECSRCQPASVLHNTRTFVIFTK
ncbi:Furin-like protease 2 [Amphibalanus amphitrite]|uniref:Furin-like protease 2 n=1 Tax=Amphibalanus amphitrite TaxID=1232801 RepID=A0A6A4V0Z7_AMPAM|nr:Furin-like protease 2 [Amphibalanus amphitrite]